MKEIAIITGANGGMGQEITKAVVNAGYHVVMACREIEQASIIMQRIKRETCDDIELIPIDLSNFKSIDNFTKEIFQKFSSIKLLINNAGTLPPKASNTIEGVEQCIGVNYLGHYILTNKLLPLLKSGSRIVNTVSLTYKYGKIKENFFEPVSSKNYNRFTHYSNSKLAFFYFTMDAAKELKERGITANCSDPGIVNTPIIRMYNRIIDPLCNIFFRPIIKTPYQGASTAIHLALSPDMENITGQCYANKKNTKISPKILDSPQRLLLRTLTQQFLEDKNITL